MPAAAAGLRVDHERWRESLDALMDRISPRFARYDAARNAGDAELALRDDIRRNSFVRKRTTHARSGGGDAR